MNKTSIKDVIEPEDGVFYPVVPLRDMVVCPNTLTTIFMSRSVSVEAAERAMESPTSLVVLATQRDKSVESPGPSDLWDVAVMGELSQVLSLPDGSVKALVHALKRCRIAEMRVEEGGVMEARLTRVETVHGTPEQIEPFYQNLMKLLQDYARMERKISQDVLKPILEESDRELACDHAAALFQLSIEDRLKFLRLESLAERYEFLLEVGHRVFETDQLDKRIQQRVKSQMERNQREYYLNEQMKAIRKELGENEEDDPASESKMLERRIEEANLPENVKTAALAEVKRLRTMPPSSSEAAVVRGYIDTLISVPWTKKSDVNTDISRAREILDEDHWGLAKVKERILEYLAVQKRVGKVKSPILCLVGAPGVGKTSLGRSIARATNREYVRMALGGVSDEAEIRGHRRTYVGAMPGQVIKHLVKAGVRNPLFLLDEIDKMGESYRGDPAAALLEVLDPEQNNTFEDHYVEIPYDLSDVLFVATSNSYNMPPALLDRMEVIALEGYTEDEKVHIAERHLVGKQMQANGVTPSEVRFEREALLEIIRYYTRESGVRGLERSIGKILRKVVLKHLEKNEAEKKDALPIVIDAAAAAEYLGARKYSITEAQREPKVGLVNGLSWSTVGGDILMIEALSFPGKGVVTRTGMLGDVMKESVEAARSVVRARAAEFGLESEIFAKTDWHIHFPEGATPKDGPSAGAAIVTAMVSSLTGIPVRSDVAMTGEITLRGDVLPIGGLREKLLAALRGGVKKVLVPAENEKDVLEIPKEDLTGLELVYVKQIEEVLEHALVRMPTPLPPPVKPLTEVSDRSVTA